MGKVIAALALFMTGEMFAVPFAPFLALPLIAPIKPLTANRAAERVLAALFIPCAAVTAVSVPLRFAELDSHVSLPQTPGWLIAAITLAAALFLTAGGPEGVKKFSAFTMPFVLGFLLLTTLLLLGKLRIGGLAVPFVWEHNPVFLACEGITLLGLMPALRYKEKPFRAYLAALLAACGIGAAVWALACLTLDAELFGSVKYPFYTALRVAKGGELIGRVEALLIPVSLCVAVLKSAACMAVISYGVRAYAKR